MVDPSYKLKLITFDYSARAAARAAASSIEIFEAASFKPARSLFDKSTNSALVNGSCSTKYFS